MSRRPLAHLPRRLDFRTLTRGDLDAIAENSTNDLD
jgi:hypothetical protein